MNREELLIMELKTLESLNDPERAHQQADDLLLDYIGNWDIAQAFRGITKYYS